MSERPSNGGAPRSEIDADEAAAEAIGLDGALYATGGYLELDGTLNGAVSAASADAASFTEAMARLASGVVMVTTLVSGRPWGMTVSACCSISVEPPLLLVSLHRRTQSWRAIRASRTFGVSILGRAQKGLAELGSAIGSPKFVDEFCERVAGETGSPRLRGAMCHLDCDVHSTQEAGTHGLIIGRVRRVECMGPTDPLIYFDRTFRHLGGPAEH